MLGEGILTRNNILLVLAVVVGIVILVVVFAKPWTGPETGVLNNGQPSSGSPAPQGSLTRQAAPTNVVVPSKNTTNVPENVAVPKEVSPGNISGTTSYRSFALSASGGKFSPDTIIVQKGDTVNLSFTSVDGDYDFTQPDFGFNVAVPRGSMKPIKFEATAPGKFIFYCKTCGGPSSGPVGYLIIAAK